MDEKRLSQILREIAQEAIPDDMNLWSDIQKAAQRPSRWMRLAPKSRIGWVALLIAAMLTIGATAYAVDYLLQTFRDPGLLAADNANLIVHFNETQTIGDVSVTLEYAYADANRITVAYMGTAQVQTADGSTPNFTSAILTDDTGRVFTSMFGGYGGGGGTTDGTQAMVSFGAVTNFDATVIEGSPETLNLRLELTVGEISDSIEQRESATATRVPPVKPFEEVGPFVFEFSIPFNPGQVMDQSQTVTTADMPMTLNRVVVTPSLARLELCFEQPSPADGEEALWQPVVSLNVSGEEVLSGYSLLADSPASSAGCWNYNILQSLVEHTGEWTLTIDSLRLPGSADDQAVRQALSERGIETIDQPGGGFGYITPPDADYDAIYRIVEQVYAELEQSITGGWTFTFVME